VNFPKLIKCRAARGPDPLRSPPRLLFGAPSRRTLGWRPYCFDPHPRTVMPTTRASSAAPEAGALPIPTESRRSILVQNVAGQPGTGRVGFDNIKDSAVLDSANGVDLAARLCSRKIVTPCQHLRLRRPSIGSRIVFLHDLKGWEATALSADGVDLAAHLCNRETVTRCRHRRLCRPSVGSRIVARDGTPRSAVAAPPDDRAAAHDPGSRQPGP